MKAKDLGGLILTSPNPKRLATFYREVIGVPLELQSHGNTPEHWECTYSNIHFAIIPEREEDSKGNTVVPSFVVDNIEEFVNNHGLGIVDPIMDLGESGYVAAVQDVDNNTIRLWTYNKS